MHFPPGLAGVVLNDKLPQGYELGVLVHQQRVDGGQVEAIALVGVLVLDQPDVVLEGTLRNVFHILLTAIGFIKYIRQ